MKSPVRRGRPREFDRETALDRALETFWQWGYEATSIAQLTQAMGIGPPSLYAAFGSKEALFLDALGRYAATSKDLTLDREPTARQALENLLLCAAREFTASSKRRGCFVLCAAANLAESSRRIGALVRKRRKAGEALILRRLERAIREGELPADIDKRALAKLYASIYQGMSTQARDGASRASLEAVAEWAMLAWPTPVAREIPVQRSVSGKREPNNAG